MHMAQQILLDQWKTKLRDNNHDWLIDSSYITELYLKWRTYDIFCIREYLKIGLKSHRNPRCSMD